MTHNKGPRPGVEPGSAEDKASVRGKPALPTELNSSPAVFFKLHTIIVFVTP